MVVAYGLILPKPILDAPRLGCFNVHASLLPRWRGAAPIKRAIMAGDKESGVTIMQMDEGLDTGAMAMAERMPIGPDMTAGDLHDELVRLGADLMARALAAARARFARRSRRKAKAASPTPKRSARTKPASIGPSRRSQVHDHIRGLSPFPGAWFETRRHVRIKVLRSSKAEGQRSKSAPGTVLDDNLTIACGDGAVRLVQVQREGKAADERR